MPTSHANDGKGGGGVKGKGEERGGGGIAAVEEDGHRRGGGDGDVGVVVGSGFCILEDRKVVVLNKFLPLEGRINTLIDLVPQLKIDAEGLSPDSRKWFDDIMGRYHAAQGGSEESTQ